MSNNTPAKYDIKQGLVESGLDITSAEQLLEAYGMPLTEVGAKLATHKDIVVTDESDKAGMQQAKELRKEFGIVRRNIKKRHDELKADILKKGNAIDFVNRMAGGMLKEAEDYLEQQEKFAENKAKERAMAKLSARRERIAELTDNPAAYAIATMSDEEFDKLVAKLTEDKAKADELAELQAKQAAADAKAREEAEERARVAEAAAKKEREEREALERKEREREAEEQRKREQAEAEAKARAAAPDKEKLTAAVNALDIETPPLATDGAMELYGKLCDHLERTKAMYIKQIEEQL